MSPMNPAGESAFWQGRRVLVTGCTGLVGAWTTRLLVARGAHVVGLVRDRVPGSDLARSGLLRRIDRVHGSLEDLPLLDRAVNEYEVQTIIHLAAQTIVGTANRSPMATFEANIRGTYHLLEAARRSGLNPDVVLASSDKAYGDQRGGAYNEQTPLRPEHPYDVSKACADMIGRAYAVTYGLPVCVTRCGNFFGGGDLNWNRIVPGTIKALLEDRPPVLRSTGTPVRDYFYAKDGAEAYLLLARRMAEDRSIHGEAFNFSANFRLSAIDMVERLSRLAGGRHAPRVLANAPNEIPHQEVDSSKAREVLGWKPRHGLDEALLETMAWYRAHLARAQADAADSNTLEFRAA
ncbi:MAG: GDP-mannose 4,6-dehydratase [Planctomycetota bacterium]